MSTLLPSWLRRGFRSVGFIVAGVVVLLLVGALIHWSTHGRTPSIRGQGKEGPERAVASLEWMDLGGVRQAVLIRGEDLRRPVVLMLHGGPGMPQMYLAHSFQRPLERDFVVVQWDRRGAGKSFRPDLRPESITASKLVEDTIELALALRERFRPPRLVLVGHSWGSYLGVEVAARRPDLFDLYVGVGQLAYFGEKNRDVQRRFIREQAALHGDEDVLRSLDAGISSLEPLLFRYGAEVHDERSWWPMLWRGLAAPEYTLADIAHVVKGLSLYGRTELGDSQPDPIDSVPRLEIPVAFFTGRYDQTDPAELTELYFQKLEAPRKRMVWFEKSAHFPFLEEPQTFADELRREVERLGSRVP